jgi:hypothetical protein
MADYRWGQGQQGGRVQVGYPEPVIRPNMAESSGILPFLASALQKTQYNYQQQAAMEAQKRQDEAAMARTMAAIAGQREVAQIGAESEQGRARTSAAADWWQGVLTNATPEERNALLAKMDPALKKELGIIDTGVGKEQETLKQDLLAGGKDLSDQDFQKALDLAFPLGTPENTDNQTKAKLARRKVAKPSGAPAAFEPSGVAPKYWMPEYAKALAGTLLPFAPRPGFSQYGLQTAIPAWGKAIQQGTQGIRNWWEGQATPTPQPAPTLLPPATVTPPLIPYFDIKR